MDILDGKRKDAEMNDLISIGTYGLHTMHRAFQHGKEASNWHVKKLFAAMFKIFHEPLPKRALVVAKMITYCNSVHITG